MPVATQKTDTGLTQGLLRVLHKQVREGPHRLGPRPAESLAWPWLAALGESVWSLLQRRGHRKCRAQLWGSAFMTMGSYC